MRLRQLQNLKRAAAGSQYALLLGLIGVVVLFSIASIGLNVKALFINVANRLDNSGQAAVDLGTGGGSGPACTPDSGNDPNFLSTGAGANNAINTILVQPDDKVLIGGVFSSYNGTGRLNLARVNSDGSLDTGFMNGISGTNSYVYALALQPDGKVIVGGNFTSYAGTTRNRLLRLNTDGSLDTGFAPSSGPDNNVYSVVVQPDGKILLGGGFAYYNGTLRYTMARANADGTLDTSFMAGSHNGTSGTGAIQDVKLLADGRVLIAGDFTLWDGASRNRIARMNADGTNDATFLNGLTGANNSINKMLPLSSGQIYVVGNFTTFNGTARTRIARLNADGSLDTSFASGSGTDGVLYAIDQQADGKLLIGGNFTVYRGNARAHIARVNTDGSNDGSFLASGTGASNPIYTLDLQSDGRPVIAGGFSTYNGATRGRLARLGCL